jgi:RNA-binding protein NOB1
VSEFAKKTGDYAALSIPDLKFLALSWMIHKELVGVDSLRNQPLAVSFGRMVIFFSGGV